MKVQLERVSLAYSPNNMVLRDVDLCVESGERIAILGSSGSGKTSLLRVIAGLEAVTGGSVRIGGQDRTGALPNARGVTMAFQSPALYPHYTVAENLAAGRADVGLNPARNPQIRALAELLEIGAFLDRYPASLSGGQKARVALGRAIASKKSVVLLDEPFAGLDGPLRVAIREMLLQLHRRQPFTIIFVSHDPEDANIIGERVVVLDSGMILQQGSPERVYSCPATWTVARLTSRVPWNRLDLKVERRGDRYLAVSGQPNLEDESPMVMVDWHCSWEGQEVVAGIRPESMRVGGLTASDLGIIKFSGKLVRYEGAGVDRLAVLESEKLTYRVRDQLDELVCQTGESKVVCVHANEVYWFEKSSEKRIEPHLSRAEQ